MVGLNLSGAIMVWHKLPVCPVSAAPNKLVIGVVELVPGVAISATIRRRRIATTAACSGADHHRRSYYSKPDHRRTMRVNLCLALVISNAAPSQFLGDVCMVLRILCLQKRSTKE